MQNVLWSLTSFVKDATDYNSATLSGAVDVVAVKQEDGSFCSTPFHVRFGKFKLFRSRQKPVKLFVNGKETPLKMKLGSQGAAYFVQETEEPVEDSIYATSPLGSPLSSPDISPTMSPTASPRGELQDKMTSFSLDSTGNSSDTGQDKEQRTAFHSDDMDSAEHSVLNNVATTNEPFISTFSDGGFDVDATGRPELLLQDKVFQRADHRDRSMSTSRPWSTYNNWQKVIRDFNYPENPERTQITVRNNFEHTIAIGSPYQVVVWEFSTQVFSQLE